MSLCIVLAILILCIWSRPCLISHCILNIFSHNRWVNTCKYIIPLRFSSLDMTFIHGPCLNLSFLQWFCNLSTYQHLLVNSNHSLVLGHMGHTYIDAKDTHAHTCTHVCVGAHGCPHPHILFAFFFLIWCLILYPEYLPASASYIYGGKYKLVPPPVNRPHF